MTTENAAPLSEEELQAAQATLDACPDLTPYATARGGVVIFNGPFPMPKAQAAVDFINGAKERERRLVETIRELQRQVERKDFAIHALREKVRTMSIQMLEQMSPGQVYGDTETVTIEGEPKCLLCGRVDMPSAKVHRDENVKPDGFQRYPECTEPEAKET